MKRPARGKTDRDSEGGSIHPLAHHSMDVAAVFLRLLQLPVIRSRLEVSAGIHLTDVDCQRLAVMAFLRDIGKVHPGFQAKGWPEGLSRGRFAGTRRKAGSLSGSPTSGPSIHSTPPWRE